MTVVKRDGKIMATYKGKLPEETAKQMKKAGCKIKEVNEK